MDTWPHGRWACPAGQAGLNLCLCTCVIQCQSLLLMLSFQLPTLSIPRCPRAFLAYLLTVTLVATSVCVQAEHFAKAASHKANRLLRISTAVKWQRWQSCLLPLLQPLSSPRSASTMLSRFQVGKKKQPCVAAFWLWCQRQQECLYSEEGCCWSLWKGNQGENPH